MVEIWCEGSVVCLWLFDFMVDVLGKNLFMDGIVFFVVDFGEGCWIVVEVIDLNVVVLVILLLLFEWLCLCDVDLFFDKLFVVMCN